MSVWYRCLIPIIELHLCHPKKSLKSGIKKNAQFALATKLYFLSPHIFYPKN